MLGDGTFGTVWLSDWHSVLPSGTHLSAMQCGAGARPEWNRKRLVAVKRLKRQGYNWESFLHVRETNYLQRIPRHPNIIALYDFFYTPTTREVYMVFECMEGNLYQLIRSRRARLFSHGLVLSIFSQVLTGLEHIHQLGLMHRDIKPENLLVTTTCITDYPRLESLPSTKTDRDVAVIIKIADFGHVRGVDGSEYFTQHISIRWYRAPEVILRSQRYSAAIDMWALGVVMGEVVLLRPLFPGAGEVDQIDRICEVLGNPSVDYGVDKRGVSCGGGRWTQGLVLAGNIGFTFPQVNLPLCGFTRDIHRS